MLLGTSTPAATLVFSNLVQPGDQYGPDSVGIGHTPAFSAGDYLEYAVRFTLSNTVALSSLVAPLGVFSGPNHLDAFLLSDSAGQPGAILESFSLSGLPGGFPLPLLAIPSGLNPVLVAGQQYWFAATGGPDTFGGWALNLFQGDPTDGGASRTVMGGVPQPWIVGTGSRTGALEVFGDLVSLPEPSYTTMLLAAMLTMLLTACGRVFPR